jgi:hypothetical protein
MSVTVTKILHSRQGVETWVTSDGRAYFVELDETDRLETSPFSLRGVDQRNKQVSWCIFQVLMHLHFPRIWGVMKMDCYVRLSITRIHNCVFGGTGLAFMTLKLPSGYKNGVVVIPRMVTTQNPYTMNLGEQWQLLSTESFR